MITVIGGSGFIGTRFCQNLYDRGVPFEIVDLKASNRFPDRTKIADIRDAEALRDAISGEAIVHLAAVHRDDVQDRSLYYQTNVDGTRNICDAAADKGITKIVFTSTVAVYGFADPDTGEDGPVQPFNDYGKSKHEGENILRAWYNEAPEQRSLTIARPTVVFGEGNRGNVYNLLNQIATGRFVMIGSGQNRKSMAYVGNMAAFLEAALESDAGCRVFNYVDKPDYDMNTLVSEVREKLRGKHDVGLRIPCAIGLALGYVADAAAKATGRSLPLSSIRVRKFCATTAFATRAQELEGFEPPYSLKEALDATVKAEFIRPDPDREVFFTE